MSNLLDRLERHMIMAPRQEPALTLLIDASGEIRRLEKENADLKSWLIEIRNLSQREGYSFEHRSSAATRLATEALMA